MIEFRIIGGPKDGGTHQLSEQDAAFPAVLLWNQDGLPDCHTVDRVERTMTHDPEGTRKARACGLRRVQVPGGANP